LNFLDAANWCRNLIGLRCICDGIPPAFHFSGVQGFTILVGKKVPEAPLENIAGIFEYI
jgi:hypothetical protein